MRCRKCNVDIAEEYIRCPLCCSEAFNDEPLINGIVTAEFPRITEKKKTLNLFPVFLAVWAVVGVISVILHKTGLMTDFSASLMFSVVPFIWTLILRPLFIRQFYKGNYIVMNFYPMALFICVYGYFSELDFSFYSFYLAAVTFIVCFLLFVYVLFRKKDSVRSSSYFVLLTAFSAIFILVGFINSSFDSAWIYPIIISVAGILLLFSRYNTSLFEELKAKFSIQ